MKKKRVDSDPVVKVRPKKNNNKKYVRFSSLTRGRRLVYDRLVHYRLILSLSLSLVPSIVRPIEWKQRKGAVVQ